MGPRKVLIVEDCHVQGEALREALRRRGWDAEWTSTAYGARRALHAYHPDIMLLDLILPDADGMVFLRELRKDERWKSMPVVILSAAAGMVAHTEPQVPYMEKPADVDDIERALVAHIHRPVEPIPN